MVLDRGGVNALCESFFVTLGCDLVDRSSFLTPTPARLAVVDFVEPWYSAGTRRQTMSRRSPSSRATRRARPASRRDLRSRVRLPAVAPHVEPWSPGFTIYRVRSKSHHVAIRVLDLHFKRPLGSWWAGAERWLRCPGIPGEGPEHSTTFAPSYSLTVISSQRGCELPTVFNQRMTATTHKNVEHVR